MIERTVVKLLEARRELRMRYHSREKGAEKGETDVMDGVQDQPHLEGGTTWARVEACWPRGSRSGGFFNGETETGSRAAALRPWKPSGTDVCAGNIDRHGFIRKGFRMGEGSRQFQHPGAVSTVAFPSKSTSSNYLVARNIVRSGSGREPAPKDPSLPFPPKSDDFDLKRSDPRL